MMTFEIQAIDGVLVITRMNIGLSERETYQFSGGEMIELTVSEVIEMRINGNED